MKKHLSEILLILVFIVGLGLLIYPSFSDFWNSMHQTRMIGSYVEKITHLDNSDREEMKEKAVEYNCALAEKGTNFQSLTEEEWEVYESLLDVTGTGIIGYVEIPTIRCSLPVYHGTDESVLAVATGHLEWSSLPIGGESTHSVISGHRGLPSAKLFSEMDRLMVGDEFYLNVLGETLTYEIDQILIVLPADMDSLRITEGKDYCTLVTCTPYGINTHRILVRGHRIATAEELEEIRVTADALQIKPQIVAPFVGIPILILMLIGIMVVESEKRKRK